MKNHKKHAEVTKPNYGFFGRNEWSIVGTPCGNIKKLAFELTKRLSEQHSVAYVDADHAGADAEAEQGRNAQTAMAHGAKLEYTDKITFHRFDVEQKFDSYQYRQWFNETDLVLVNGNHFQAKHQIVVIDPKKEKSLLKRLKQLTDVQLILLTEGVENIFPFLQEHLPESSNIPILPSSDIKGIADFLLKKMQATQPPLHGLVLAGGKSERMGQDKGALDYHGKPQREHAADLLSRFCDQTFISTRPMQAVESAHPLLADKFLELGPYGAILSAFQQQPNAAWLVVACDLPLLDEKTLEQLVANRNRSKMATAFHNPETQFPEPLITIWEPRAYPVLLQFLAQGYTCPRKVLINSSIEELQIENVAALRNVNKPEELEAVLNLVKNDHIKN